MLKKMQVTPKFIAEDIYHKTFGIDWPEFQVHALNMGKNLHKYMQTFINANHKRSGGKGTLAKAVNFTILSTTGMIHWGIGHIPTLQQRAKGWGGGSYWHVVNYGKKVGGQSFIPGGGKYRPVEFADGSKPDPSKRGNASIGSSRVTKWAKISKVGGMKPSVIRPMNFVSASYKMLRQHIVILLARYGKGKK